MIQFDEHIFQQGWNHQLVKLSGITCLVREIKLKLLSQGPLAEWDKKMHFFWDALRIFQHTPLEHTPDPEPTL